MRRRAKSRYALLIALLILSALASTSAAFGTAYAPIPDARLADPAPAQGGSFGEAVAIEGALVAIGTPGKTITSSESGGIQLFARSGAGWSHTTTLVPTSTAPVRSAGLDVALSADLLVATAIEPRRVFTYAPLPDGTWAPGQDAVPSDGGGQGFGEALALDDDMVAVGAPYDDSAGLNTGAVYLFTREADGSWAQVQKVVPSNASSYALFGSDVALDADVLVVGAPGDASPTVVGAVHVFERDGSAWVQTAKLVAPDAREHDQFGTSVSVRGDTLVVGAPFRDGADRSVGGAYVYKRLLGTWTYVATLENPAPTSNDQFGSDLVLHNDVLVVGAPGADVGATNTGAAYVYGTATGMPILQTRLLPEPATVFGTLGAALATDGDTIVAGSPGTGTAYAYPNAVPALVGAR